jgi:hypothetical protein
MVCLAMGAAIGAAFANGWENTAALAGQKSYFHRACHEQVARAVVDTKADMLKVNVTPPVIRPVPKPD